MSQTNILLQSLTNILNDIKLKDESQLRKMSLNKNGNLCITLTNGKEYTIPKLGPYINENVLYKSVDVAREFKRRGFFSSVVTFFQLVALFIALIVITTIIIIGAVVKSIFKKKPHKK